MAFSSQSFNKPFLLVMALLLFSSGVIAIGMTGIGATVHYKVLIYYIKRPKAYIVGVLLQLLLMPRKYLMLCVIFNFFSFV